MNVTLHFRESSGGSRPRLNWSQICRIEASGWPLDCPISLHFYCDDDDDGAHNDGDDGEHDDDDDGVYLDFDGYDDNDGGEIVTLLDNPFYLIFPS